MACAEDGPSLITTPIRLNHQAARPQQQQHHTPTSFHVELACSTLATVHRRHSSLDAPPHHLFNCHVSKRPWSTNYKNIYTDCQTTISCIILQSSISIVLYQMPMINERSNNGDRSGNSDGDLVVDIYPLSSYYFSSKAAAASKDETLADRALRLKSNYDAYGMRTCVEAVILVELFKHPHLLLLQSKNCIYKLPGGRLRAGESDVNGLKRKLLSKLSADDDNYRTHWEVSECIGTWWKSDFETLPYPYFPSSGRTPKECTKLYLVKLPSNRDFIVPKNFKLLAVPMCQLHENRKTYGSIIAGIPQLLSRFSINMVRA